MADRNAARGVPAARSSVTALAITGWSTTRSPFNTVVTLLDAGVTWARWASHRGAWPGDAPTSPEWPSHRVAWPGDAPTSQRRAQGPRPRSRRHARRRAGPRGPRPGSAHADRHLRCRARGTV